MEYMQCNWTRSDISKAWDRVLQYYQKDPVICRALCGHEIEEDGDAMALDYWMIGVWLVEHRKYREWSKEKSEDLRSILEFMRTYRMKIPKYVRRTRFYRRSRRRGMRK